MSAILSLTETDVFIALRSFLLGIMPALGTDGNSLEIIRAEDNRVPEPEGSDFLVLTPIMRERLETNEDTYADVILTGAIAGAELTVTAINLPNLGVGQALIGPNITPGTTITALGSGTGGTGTYTVSPSQSITSQTIYAGTKAALQPTKTTIQIDVHGPGSADNVQIISTLFRDGYAVWKLKEINPDISPLYTSDPRQTPFINAEDQYEFKWSIDAVLQVNQSVSVSQSFADVINITLINVDAAYPLGA